MPIPTKCPHCDARETFPDVEAGNTVNCSACGGAIAVPFRARPVAAAAVARPIAAVRVVVPPVAPAAESNSDTEFQFDDEEPQPGKKSKAVIDVDEDEDRPKKKSKVVVAVDEEGYRPRKKPRRSEDEDEDDAWPRGEATKKGGGLKLLLILGGIAFVLFAGCGGLGYYFYSAGSKSVASFEARLPAPADPQAKVTFNSDPIGGRPGPDVKGNVAKVKRGDTYETIVSSKMGLGVDCTIADLEELMKNFKDPNGADKALFGAILNWYAPWIDKGCAKIYTNANLKYRAIIVFGDPKLAPPSDPNAKVKALLTVEEFGNNRTVYSEPIPVGRDVTADPDARRLGLKTWFNLKPEAGPTDPPKPSGVVKITATDLAAEVLQDRAAANKKYAGVTLEVTGEVNTRGGTGAVISLKGGTDENTMKALLVSVTMRLDARESAKKIQAGETVTVVGTLVTVNSPTSTSVVLKDGTLKK